MSHPLLGKGLIGFQSVAVPAPIFFPFEVEAVPAACRFLPAADRFLSATVCFQRQCAWTPAQIFLFPKRFRSSAFVSPQGFWTTFPAWPDFRPVVPEQSFYLLKAVKALCVLTLFLYQHKESEAAMRSSISRQYSGDTAKKGNSRASNIRQRATMQENIFRHHRST